MNERLEEILENAYPRWPDCGNITLPMSNIF